MTRKIVYADAESVELLSGERLAKLQIPGEFVIYADAPATHQTVALARLAFPELAGHRPVTPTGSIKCFEMKV